MAFFFSNADTAWPYATTYLPNHFYAATAPTHAAPAPSLSRRAFDALALSRVSRPASRPRTLAPLSLPAVTLAPAAVRHARRRRRRWQ